MRPIKELTEVIKNPMGLKHGEDRSNIKPGFSSTYLTESITNTNSIVTKIFKHQSSNVDSSQTDRLSLKSDSM